MDLTRFPVEGLSYEYLPRVSGKTFAELAGNSQGLGLHEIWLTYDFDPVHGPGDRSRTFLYADGHVEYDAGRLRVPTPQSPRIRPREIPREKPSCRTEPKRRWYRLAALLLLLLLGYGTYRAVRPDPNLKKVKQLQARVRLGRCQGLDPGPAAGEGPRDADGDGQAVAVPARRRSADERPQAVPAATSNGTPT